MLLIQFNFYVSNVIQRIEDIIPAFCEGTSTNSMAFVVFCQSGTLKIKEEMTLKHENIPHDA